MMQKIKSETIAFFKDQQREAMAKLCRDLERYERKRRIAARIIAAQKRELCDMAHALQGFRQGFIDILSKYEKLTTENKELKRKIEDLQGFLDESMAEVQEINAEWHSKDVEVKTLKWAFEHK